MVGFSLFGVISCGQSGHSRDESPLQERCGPFKLIHRRINFVNVKVSAERHFFFFSSPFVLHLADHMLGRSQAVKEKYKESGKKRGVRQSPRRRREKVESIGVYMVPRQCWRPPSVSIDLVFPSATVTAGDDRDFTDM